MSKAGWTVTEELLALERRGWAALTSDRAVEFFERVLTEDVVIVLPGMVLDRAAALESWLSATPWRDVEMRELRTVRLGTDAAMLTYRATASGTWEGDCYRAQFTSVYRRDGGRWRLAFQQQTPLAPHTTPRLGGSGQG